MSWLYPWQYRRSITIDNTNNSNTLTNYETKITLDSTNFDFSSANSDGSDIRFTEADGTTLLYYWIESWDATNQQATIWVKIPTIPASGTTSIYIYYGNSSATDASDGKNTFIFFDDFDGTALDTNNWQDLSGGVNRGGEWDSAKTPTVSVANSEVTVTYSGLSYSSTGIETLNTFDIYNNIFEAKIKNNATSKPDVAVSLINWKGVSGGSQSNMVIDSPYLSYWQAPVEHGTNLIAADTNYHIAYMHGTDKAGLVDADKWATTGFNTPSSSTNPVALAAITGGATSDISFSADWVRVRQYTNPEPTATVGTLEEFPPISTNNDSNYSILEAQTSDSLYKIFVGLSNASKYDIVETQTNESSYKIWDNSVKQENNSPYSIDVGALNDSTYYISTSAQNKSEYDITANKTNKSLYTIYLTRNAYFDSSYFVSASAKIQSGYEIQLKSENIAKYEIKIAKVNESSYHILTTQKNQSPYAIQVSQQNVSSYSMPVHQKLYSEYKIWEVFHPKVIHKDIYLITDYDWISIPNESRYGIEWSGLTSLVERYIGISEPYLLQHSDRYIHPQLFVTYEDERNSELSSYRTVPDERKSFVVREQIQSERSAIYERYYTVTDEQTALWAGYYIETDERDVEFTSFATNYSNRYTICEERETLDSDRQAFTICVWNTFRYTALRYWWPSERYAISGYCIPFKTYGDQRICHPQVLTTKLAVVRTAFVESCSYKCEITINPKYNSFSCGEVESDFRELFSSTVVTDINIFRNIPVNWTHSGFDLILIKDDASWWDNLGTNPFIRFPVQQLTENTYLFSGYLIYRHKPLYTRIEFQFLVHPGFSTADAYYQYLIEHGYLKLEINTQEIRDMQAQIDCDQPMYPIPFKFYVYKDLINKMRLEVSYAYPYKQLAINRSLLYPTKYV